MYKWPQISVLAFHRDSGIMYSLLYWDFSNFYKVSKLYNVGTCWETIGTQCKDTLLLKDRIFKKKLSCFPPCIEHEMDGIAPDSDEEPQSLFLNSELSMGSEDEVVEPSSYRHHNLPEMRP